MQELHLEVCVSGHPDPESHAPISKIIKVAAQQPEVRRITVTAEVSKECAESLLPVLLPIAEKQVPALSVDLVMSHVAGFGDSVSFLPLLPALSQLEVYCDPVKVGLIDEGVEEWLAPAVSAIPGMSKVRRCRLEIGDMPLGGNVQRLIDTVAALTSLQSLTVRIPYDSTSMRVRMGGTGAGLPSAGPASEGFLTHACALTALTCLELIVPTERADGVTPFSTISRTLESLTGLRKLTLRGRLVEPVGLVIDALAKLHLQTLVVFAGADHRGLLRGLVPQLRHLRSATFFGVAKGDSEWRDELTGLTQALPQCSSCVIRRY